MLEPSANKIGPWLRTISRRALSFVVLSVCALFSSPALCLNNNYAPALTNAQVLNYLNGPNNATHARYNLTDSAGNVMDVPSVVQMSGQLWQYAAVYHTAYTVSNGTRFKVNLAVSNDLMNWTFVRTLVDDADMPKILQVSNSSWVMITHEQWLGAGPASSSPCVVSFELYYDFSDLLSGTIRSSWNMPAWQSNLNGTPSIYNAFMTLYNGYYVVNGQYGFHFYDGLTDINGVTSINYLFDPVGGTAAYPSTAVNYNNDFLNLGATEVGDRDTLQTTTDRFNIQEVHLGAVGGDWDQWRVWLYHFNDEYSYPTGNGSVTQMAPVTPGGSYSFGGPTISIVNSPSGTGHSLVISYFIFYQGAGPNEAGSLLYYYDIP